MPPPPPPNLIAPAGYAGYTPTPMAAVPLKRVGGVHRASVIAVAVSAIVSVLAVGISQSLSDEAQAYLDGVTSSDDFLGTLAPYLLLTFVQGAAVVASIVLVMIWMYRVAANHRALHRGGTWSPGWAIGGWFLPPLLYIIPTLMLRELWKASDPEVPIGGEWASRPVSPLVTAWFVVYSLVPLGLMFLQTESVLTGFGNSEDELAKQIAGGQGVVIASTLATAASAVTWIIMTRALNHRHQRLTGEITA